MVQRVLCFPGFGQNSTAFNIKMAKIRRHCAGDVEFVILDPFYKLYPKGDTDDGSEPEESSILRAWGFPTDDEHSMFDGLEASVDYIMAFLSRQSTPFDGVFGFSQGAALASITAAHLETPDRYPKYSVNGKAPHPPMKFAILVSGAPCLDAPFAEIYADAPKLRTPVLHIIGRTDIVVSYKRSKSLIDAYDSPRVEWHEGNHFIPSKPKWQAFFKKFITSFETVRAATPPTSPRSLREDLPSPYCTKNISWTYWEITTKKRALN